MNEGIDRPTWSPGLPGVTPSVPVDPSGRSPRRPQPGNERRRRQEKKDLPPASTEDGPDVEGEELPERERHRVDIVV
jgi:hypothetical protein